MKKDSPDNDDRMFAARGVLEGSAQALMNQYFIKKAMSGEIDREELLGSIDWSNPAFDIKKLKKVPAILTRPLMDAYLQGSAFLSRGSMLGAPKKKDLKKAYTNLPVSSEQILHYEKYWDLEKLDLPQEITTPDLSESLGKDWKRGGSNVLGEIGVAILTAEPEEEANPDEKPNPMEEAMKMMSAPSTTDQATGWDGDRYDLYEGPGGKNLVIWVSTWDRKEDAKEMAEWWAERFSGKLEGRKDSRFWKTQISAPAGKQAMLACAAANVKEWKDFPSELLTQALEKSTMKEAKLMARTLETADGDGSGSEKPKKDEK
jgi:hypothetical protein